MWHHCNQYTNSTTTDWYCFSLSSPDFTFLRVSIFFLDAGERIFQYSAHRVDSLRRRNVVRLLFLNVNTSFVNFLLCLVHFNVSIFYLKGGPWRVTIVYFPVSQPFIHAVFRLPPGRGGGKKTWRRHGNAFPRTRSRKCLCVCLFSRQSLLSTRRRKLPWELCLSHSQGSHVTPLIAVHLVWTLWKCSPDPDKLS